jgi:acyl-CoA synthetase (AMP-forming)/AMP-acid ligase II
VAEAAAFGVDHPTLGQAIVLVAQTAEGKAADTQALIDACKAHLPAFMIPQHVEWFDTSLPRNANGKIDRKTLSTERAGLFTAQAKEGAR